MNKEEFTAKREQMREKKHDAIHKVCKVVGLFADAEIEDFIITGSQALIIQGFMFHRNGDDVDVRVRVPKDEERRKVLIQKLQAWAMLYPEQDASEKYKESTAKQMFTFYVKNTKVNVFAMSEEDFEAIPYNFLHSAYNVEEVGSILLDKLNLKRGKDYEDFVKCVNNLSGVCL